MVTSSELALGPDADSVPRARHFVRSALAEQLPHLSADAELVVTELVTNARLHGMPPITLRLRELPGKVRIEVEDRGRSVPVQPRQRTDTMTGRGLALVAAVCDGWGVEPGEGGGKVVWADLHTAGIRTDERVDPQMDEAALLAAWDDDLDAEARYTVRLGAVPTELLLDAKAHIDNVVREMMLASGEQRGGAAVAPEMRSLIQTVTEDFAEARANIKRQALDAAAMGSAFTDLALTLPLTAAEAGERYLAALDEADRYARDARLLTVAAPASHRAFRRWYVQGLVDQLRAVSRGEEPPLPPLFPQVLADEVNRLAATPPAAATETPGAVPRSGGDLADWRLSDVVTACSRLRASARGATSMESAAQAVISFLRDSFIDASTGKPAFVLARLFKTEELQNLPPALRELGTRLSLGAAGSSRFLTLLATAGDDPAWCDRRLSRGHQLLPVTSAEALANAPMVSALVSQLGLPVATVVQGASEEASTRADFDVFHVQQASGSPAVPGQDFVDEHEVKSVLGFGGLLPSGHTFAVVLFSRVEIPPATARLFRTVAVSVKLALMPSVAAPLFDEDARPPAHPRLTAAAQIRALEQMLEVHESMALEQAAALEERDARLRREAEVVETLRHVGQSLSSVLDVDAIVQLTTAAAVDVTGARFGAFFYNVEDDNGEASLQYTLAGVPREAFARFPMPTNTPLFAPTFVEGLVVRSDDITRDHRYGQTGPHHGLPADHPRVRSYLAAPVVSPTSGAVLGGLFFGHEELRVFDDRAERLAVGIAAQTAIALDNAKLYRRERHTALQLQQALLPAERPSSPHLVVASRYQPGTKGLHVGGDWYDVITVDADRVALVIGDVMGRGVRAAATMGQLRASIRAFAALDLPPATIADRLNDILIDFPGDQIATCLYAVYDARDRTLTYSSAGHLPPILVRPDGSTATLSGELGPPLGIPGTTHTEAAVEVDAGSALALFTDGLVESRVRSFDDGIADVQRLLSELRAATPEEICDRLLDTAAETSAEDDAALLYAQFT
ncbi:MAG: SpoIIE family protein phosphatase [Actinobacteria bacterium]|nr:SpoIIE family protein phosphatase [Actinomycetota bacterium]MCA1721199.1 SpoIIE family protein phosphatase [Actinomycetota bacterium]